MGVSESGFERFELPVMNKVIRPRCSNSLRDGSQCRSAATTVEGYCSGCARKLRQAAEAAAEVQAASTDSASVPVKARISAGEATRGASARESLRRTAESVSDDLGAFFVEAVKADRSVSAKCPNCTRAVTVTVPDWSARVRAIEVMLSQGYGKPTDANEGAGAQLEEIADRFERDAQCLSMSELRLLLAHEAIRSGRADTRLRNDIRDLAAHVLALPADPDADLSDDRREVLVAGKP